MVVWIDDEEFVKIVGHRRICIAIWGDIETCIGCGKKKPVGINVNMSMNMNMNVNITFIIEKLPLAHLPIHIP